MVDQREVFIDGEWLTPSGVDQIEVENPANEQVIATIPDCDAATAQTALTAAKKAQSDWAGLPAIERARVVHALSALVLENAESLAVSLVAEQGKPISQARGEVQAAANFLTYAAENARRIEGDIMPSDNPDEEIMIRRVPRGVIVGLTAWNYPLALAARKLGPALVSGNSFVLMSHEITPLAGLNLAALAQQAGIPAGVFNVITGRGAVAGRALVESPLSDMVTMTGSTRAGREIFRSAADQLKVLSLELGGKAPFIVMEDADLDKAVEAAVIARFTNCGQVCTCNERMYLHQDIADLFMRKFLDRVLSLRIGDPMSDPDLGPKVSSVEIDKIEELIAAAISAGAEPILQGGRLRDGEFSKGHWMSPSVLELHGNDNPIIRSEVFGPVVPFLRVASFEDAVQKANDSDYGLSAYLFTQDIRRMMRVSRELNFAEIYFNRANGEQVQGYHAGWNQSGIGGEDGKYGFDGYLKKQTMYVNWS
ncbi:aldehyde dehydrogenase family protein [Paracoccus seriniphilus]|uniref:Lactaldehyde dehydrogenase / glycolaldehyde dehydrogenase n=1 Tax=Paracoccus seriniphilus TaxID=184748 RepID=A0A239Q1C9_9RHOB|nr:aldehyde dehydrogenase family protein [Paracoccus seriniphilus]WCR15891.1 aldehyde dehydrogenase family protein [Paracoccus seriniphilus]SNT76314.1 lactaldehyde dehydrogenase / glycolaldehyde dehydrogenase [Paracoccus seriniphilus]